MLAMIQRNWVRPMVGSGVEATVHYRIQRDGRIADVRIATSSGINSFDLAALRAVQASTRRCRRSRAPFAKPRSAST
jgi:TonB family protein